MKSRHQAFSRIPILNQLLNKGIIQYIFFLEYLFRKKLGKLYKYEINTEKAHFFRNHVLNKIEDPEIRGIEHGYEAFKGPTYVVIDITNRCNNSCVGCWIHSPLIGMKLTNPQVVKYELAETDIIALIRDLQEMGTQIIRFTGGGEPLLHPAFARSVSLAKAANMHVAVTTSLPKIKKEAVDALLQVDELAISLWAADKEMYRTLHPNQPEDHFDFLLQSLQYIRDNKPQSQEITLCNVLTNKNYQTADRMIDMANVYKVDKLYFTLVDLVNGKTNSLLLSESQRKWLHDYFSQLDRNTLGTVEIDNLDGFIKRLSNPVGTQKGHYDAHLIDEIPCYMGWHFSRILANGDVIPCCRAINKTMGNIRQQRFREIWHSEAQKEFRNNGLRLSKFHPYFRDIECYKLCDNLAQNRLVQNRRLNIAHGHSTVS